MMETVTTYINPVQRESIITPQTQPDVVGVKTRPAGDGKIKEVKMQKPEKRVTHFIPTSRLKSYDIVDAPGENLGQVERIIVDMYSGRVAYYLVGLKGHLNDRWVAVPPAAMTWQPAKHNFELDIPHKTLEGAPTIPKADWPEKFLADLEKEDHARWLEEVYNYYNYTPFWIVVED